MIKVIKRFSYSQNFVPWELSALDPGLHTYIKSCNLLLFFSETAGPVFTRFHMGTSVEGALTVCPNGSAPLNNMAVMPIYGKTQLKSSSQNQESLEAESWYIASWTQDQK